MKRLEDLVEGLGGDTYHNRHSSDRKHNKNSKFRTLPKKCQTCGSTKNLDIHHPSGNRKNLKSGKGLKVLCRSCHRKLHNARNGGKGFLEEYNMESANITEVFGVGEIISFEDIDISSSTASKEFFKSVESNRQRDLMYLRFKYVHGGTNGNKDHFLTDELRRAAKTPINKPFNWEHGEPNVGVIYDSRYVEATAEEREHLEVDVAIWKYKYRSFAQEMFEAHARGELYTSMEVSFTEISCPESEGKRYPAKDEDSGNVHPALLGRFSPGSQSFRILHNMCFIGGAKVKRPADHKAGSLAVASENTKEKGGYEQMSEKNYTEAELKSAVDSAVEKAVTAFEKKSKDAQAMQARDDEIAGLKAENEKLGTKVSDAEAKATQAEEKYDGLKNEISRGAKLQDRMAKLSEAKYAFSDDEEEQKAEQDEIASMTEKQFEMVLRAASTASAKASENGDGDSEGESTAGKLDISVPVGSTFRTKSGKEKSFSYLKDLDESLVKLS